MADIAKLYREESAHSHDAALSAIFEAGKAEAEAAFDAQKEDGAVDNDRATLQASLDEALRENTDLKAELQALNTAQADPAPASKGKKA